MLRSMEKAPHGHDLAELLARLIDGPFESLPWSTFLETLAGIVRADCACLIVNPPGQRLDAGLCLAAGSPSASAIATQFRGLLHLLAAGSSKFPGEAQIISLADLHDIAPEPALDAYFALVEDYNLAQALQFRVVEAHGVEAWLCVAWCAKADHSRYMPLLAALCDPLRAVLRGHVLGERGRLASLMSAEAGRRLHCGWLLLDECGYILVADENGERMLAEKGPISRSSTGKLKVRPASLGQEVLTKVAQAANSQDARARAISIRSDPWLDMMFVPARKQMISDTAVPLVVAYVHGAYQLSEDRCVQLCDLFGLNRSEARLALALCRGRTIAEAGEDLGFKLETARSYSKSIYAKTGARGKADLVRIIMGSVLTLASDT